MHFLGCRPGFARLACILKIYWSLNSMKWKAYSYFFAILSCACNIIMKYQYSPFSLFFCYLSFGSNVLTNSSCSTQKLAANSVNHWSLLFVLLGWFSHEVTRLFRDNVPSTSSSPEISFPHLLTQPSLWPRNYPPPPGTWAIVGGRGLGGVYDHINHFGYHIKEMWILKAFWGGGVLYWTGSGENIFPCVIYSSHCLSAWMWPSCHQSYILKQQKFNMHVSHMISYFLYQSTLPPCRMYSIVIALWMVLRDCGSDYLIQIASTWSVPCDVD